MEYILTKIIDHIIGVFFFLVLGTSYILIYCDRLHTIWTWVAFIVGVLGTGFVRRMVLCDLVRDGDPPTTYVFFFLMLCGVSAALTAPLSLVVFFILLAAIDYLAMLDVNIEKLRGW